LRHLLLNAPKRPAFGGSADVARYRCVVFRPRADYRGAGGVNITKLRAKGEPASQGGLLSAPK